MSEYSTTNITRSTAKRVLVNKLMSNVTDNELEWLLDEMIFEQRLRKCRIVNDDDKNQDDVLA